MTSLSATDIVIYSSALAAAFEAITILFRFGLDLQATRDTASTIGVWTRGIRIHHGYIGALCIGGSFLAAAPMPALAGWVLIVGLSLLASDMAHHFLVLWPIVGSPEFDLIYRRTRG